MISGNSSNTASNTPHVKPAETGDSTDFRFYCFTMVVSAGLLLLFLAFEQSRKKHVQK